jgi:tetratricopeptide (TPR) repeat protein
VPDPQQAADTSRPAPELSPTTPVHRTNSAPDSLYAGNFDTAVTEAETVLKENPQYQWAGLTLALSRAAQGREADARAAYARLRAMNSLGYSLAAMGEADLEMYFGRPRQALGLLQDGVARDEKENPGSLPMKLIAVAEAQMALGNKPEAIKAAERAASLSTHEAVLVPAAHLLTQLNQAARAEEIASQLKALVPAQLRSYALVITGEVKLSRNNLAGAIDDFKAAQKLHDSWYVHLMLGDAYEKVQDWPSAMAERELCVKRRGEATDVFFDDTASIRYLPPVYYHLARAQEAVGGSVTAGARGTYELFLQTRAAADPPDPLAADARRRLGR